MAMFVAFKAVVEEGARQPLLARLRQEEGAGADIVREVVKFL